MMAWFQAGQKPLPEPMMMQPHDDFIKWNQFPRYWLFVTGIHWSLVDSPTTASELSFDVFFMCAWTNGWANNRDTSDLRQHRTHYDVTVMH